MYAFRVFEQNSRVPVAILLPVLLSDPTINARWEGFEEKSYKLDGTNVETPFSQEFGATSCIWALLEVAR
ncbi:hypothetical protein C2G38_2196329 [Gigaspora rosea]|uniref:Uncharacterized protein n=1 Tax=Gigaspora rosea TaxID=44941 RepID=A0A397V3X0_9GLOM|nr:hypothetical protein C2G38_2196329 [Gigaspora rosea]